MTPYVKGMYRRENINYAKLTANEQNNAANALVLAETLERLKVALGICSWCGVRPANGGAQNACAECEDTLLSCL